MIVDLMQGIELGTVYRSASAANGAGVDRKPTPRGGYVDRVLENYVLVYVLDGTGTFTDWNGQSHEVTAGAAIQMPAGRKHSVVHRPDGKWLEAWLSVRGRFAQTLIDFGSINEQQPVLWPGVERALLDQFSAIRSQLHDSPDRDLPSALVTAHQLLVAIHTADRRRGTVDPQTEMIERVAGLLARDLEERLDVEQIAAGLDLSYERFRKLFRQRMGVSPGEYRIRRRIDQARSMLIQQRLSNKEIAYALGYADPFTFSKQFKRFVGMSPTAFRKRA